MDSLNQLPQFVQGVGRYHRPALAALMPLRQALGYGNRREVVPDSANKAVGPVATYEQRITIPAGSFLWAIAAASGQAQGFRMQVIDMASGRGLLSQSADFTHTAGGTGYPLGIRDCTGAAVHIRQPLYVLPKPRVVIDPGMLKVQVTNLANAVNLLQVVLHFATPPEAGAARNEWNGICEAEVDLCRRAVRGQTVTTQTGGSTVTAPTADQSDPMSSPASNIPFNVSGAGANLVIPGTVGYRIAIHQLSLYNTVEQTVRLLDGDTDLMGPLTNMAVASGYFLPYQEEPHFVLTDGRPFQIHLAGLPAGAVTGFAKYRMFERWGN